MTRTLARTETSYGAPKIIASREDLLGMLEARRPWAERFDANNAKRHQAEEREALEGFRSLLKEAARWDYKTAQSNHFRVSLNRYPECPASAVAFLDRAIRTLEMSHQKRMTISADGDYARIHWLLTYDENEKGDVC